MRSRWMPVAWVAVLTVTALRALLAAKIPLTGDEAYYWEWSRRLAAGYVDHPPAVAFCIAFFAWLGHSAFAVRIGFVLCGAAAALFTGAAAREISGDSRAGAIAAICTAIIPMFSVTFGTASPDGPYAAAWAASLYFAVRAFNTRSTMSFALLGVCLGSALLARELAWGLVAGVVIAACTTRYRSAWRGGLWISLLVALALYAPYLWWNATHAWASFAFALVQRHPSHEVQWIRPLSLAALTALAFSPGIWIAAIVALTRERNPLILWTTLPMSLGLLLLSMHERVEVYWFIGPFISICAAVGCAVSRWEPSRQRSRLAWILSPAAALSAILFGAGLLPGAGYAALRAAHIRLADGGPFEMFTYQPLAHDVSRLIAEPGTVAMTDGYGFSSLLDFYAGVPPVVIGYDAQGREARRWFTGAEHPVRALFIDKVPLASRPDFSLQLSRACARVVPGPVLTYRGSASREVSPRAYYTTWCEHMQRDAVATLRWETAKT